VGQADADSGAASTRARPSLFRAATSPSGKRAAENCRSVHRFLHNSAATLVDHPQQFFRPLSAASVPDRHCAVWSVSYKLARMNPMNFSTNDKKGGIVMKNPLDSLWGTVISGLILTVVLFLLVKSFLA
jgi:hypothetical protein